MSRRRAALLAALLLALLVYGAVARQLPGLPSGAEVVVHSLVVFPAFAAAIWLGLPLARLPVRSLLITTAVSGVLAVSLTLLGAGGAGNVAKLAFYALLGFSFLVFFEELWWVALVAVLVPWVDVWSVAAGPTEYVVEQQPGLFERISIALPSPGEPTTINVGPPDVLFFALFLATADRFALRVRWTWTGMTCLLAATLVLVWTWEDVGGLPALPAVCLGFLIPNLDLLWRDLRRARAHAGA